ncbi:DUF4180 domain-containing protein [Ruminococcaceae bacterium OttesenSCG-928-D13]|nr:DUF4180 domain-containing protein [Ruminococcaceae bacterium OttesenSCG-928-D13]
MEFETLPGAADIIRAVNTTDTPLIADTRSALDLIGTARHLHGEVKLVVDKADVAEDFFDLKTGLAGEVLQKFVNYNLPLAIVGDFSGYTSKALRDFIYESNQGSAVFFVPDVETAAEKLGRVGL